MQAIRMLLALAFGLVMVRSGIADEGETKPSTAVLCEIVDVAQQNYEKIETLSAIYEWHQTTPKRRPSSGDIHFVWDRKQNRFRSNYRTPEFNLDSVTTPTAFVRIGPGKTKEYPASDSRRFWSAGVLSPARLFGTSNRPLWQTLDAYTRWPEANDRITITKSGVPGELVYTIRMAYFSNVSNEKVFVTRKLLEQNAFNPSLVVRSAGIDANTANVIDITSWTYKKREGIVIPRSITHSKFEEQTGVPVSHRSLHLSNRETQYTTR